VSQLRILISHSSVYKKAGWCRIFPLAVGLAKNGNQVTILTTNPHFSIFINRVVIDKVDIIIFPEIIPSRISRLGFGFLSLILKVLYVLFRKYDIVHSDNGHRPMAGIPCRVQKKLFDTVYVAEWYDWYGKGGQYDNKKKLFKILLGRYELKHEIKDKQVADGIVVLSELLRTRAEQFKPKERIIKIHGGANISSIPFLYDNSQVKEKYNISKDTLTFGYINSYSYRLAEFIPLLNTITKNHLTSKVKILLFGDSSQLIKQLPPEMSDQIICFGWIDFEKDYEKLQCVDVFFLFKEEMLGNRAGWPNCIGDYLACGRPVLLNPVGEVIEFAKKYPFAFIECTKDEDDIYSKIKFISANLEQLRKQNPVIRKLAEDTISWEKKSMDLLDFYLYLIKTKRTKESIIVRK
jgi:glycosyltransferase involved in cell wall biosynthesis